MAPTRIVALAGGTGAAKLLRGLAASLDSSALSVVVNTGDDAEVWGLHVSPDLDSVMYALAGVLDVGRGWGRADETFRCLSTSAGRGACGRGGACPRRPAPPPSSSSAPRPRCPPGARPSPCPASPPPCPPRARRWSASVRSWAARRGAAPPAPSCARAGCPC